MSDHERSCHQKARAVRDALNSPLFPDGIYSPRDIAEKLGYPAFWVGI